MSTITTAIRDSEGRLRAEIKASEERLRTENREAHAGITRNIEDVKQDIDAEWLAGTRFAPVPRE